MRVEEVGMRGRLVPVSSSSFILCPVARGQGHGGEKRNGVPLATFLCYCGDGGPWTLALAEHIGAAPVGRF